MKTNRDLDDISFKIITIGNSGVGKTSILQRYIYNTFNEEHLATTGLEYSYKNVTLENGKTIKLKLFDTAGQEKFHSLSKTYFKNADGVLFVYAVNDIDSFKNIKNWINIFNENYNRKTDIPLYLIENKKDLNSEVERSLVDYFLEENKNFRFKSTSAALDYENSINELFQELSEILYEKYQKFENKEQRNIRLSVYIRKKKKGCIICSSYA